MKTERAEHGGWGTRAGKRGFDGGVGGGGEDQVQVEEEEAVDKV